MTKEGRGTELPRVTLEVDDPLLVLHAVSALTRTCLSHLARRGRPRTLYLRAAHELCPRATHAQIGALVNVGWQAAHRAAGTRDSAVRLVERVVGDPRFPPLTDRPIVWANEYYNR